MQTVRFPPPGRLLPRVSFHQRAGGGTGLMVPQGFDPGPCPATVDRMELCRMSGRVSGQYYPVEWSLGLAGTTADGDQQ